MGISSLRGSGGLQGASGPLRGGVPPVRDLRLLHGRVAGAALHLASLVLMFLVPLVTLLVTYVTTFVTIASELSLSCIVID
ncbi:hypothetical protein JTE90_004742 [Oedothorax gibbosus]|uniref:Uncharacterized protein n=1 Tax=Oedothorax gibbosus TaxID=931172 RepID=A0AAV6TKE1_9ARAC|nr:hypothetical protein JTE90_004742 [Oedothorax gibbosus]